MTRLLGFAARLMRSAAPRYSPVTVVAMTLWVTTAVSGEVAEPCIGDCNEDGRVTVAELVTIVRAVLGLTGESCGFSDRSTVDALVRAVNKALRGCDAADTTSTPTEAEVSSPTRTATGIATDTPIAPQPTHTPTYTATIVLNVTPTSTRTVGVESDGVDLFVTRIERERCKNPTKCTSLPPSAVTICIGNGGDRFSAPVAVSVNGAVTNIGSLSSGAEVCFHRDFSGNDAIAVQIDPEGRIEEADDENNFASAPTLGPTSCDVLGPPCGTTPTPAPHDRCENCCDHCADAACIEQCVGTESCTLVADYAGVVTDASTGEPIANAAVTVNDVTAVTDADGHYAFRSARRRVCTALDYFFNVSVAAPGFAPLQQSFYRTPSSAVTNLDAELAPMNPAAFAIETALARTCRPSGIVAYAHISTEGGETSFMCRESAGHESAATVIRHPDAATAAAVFENAPGPEETFHGYRARFSESSEGGNRFFREHFLWLADCWTLTANSFDDTHFTYISPQPREIAEAIYSVALPTMLDQCN